jgi:C-terminal processing protease CtpA/Prc
MGKFNSDCSISTSEIKGNKKTFKLKHSMLYSSYYKGIRNKTKSLMIENNIVYLNLDQIKRHEIDSLMPNIIESKGLICDLRGYPADDIMPFLSKMMHEPETIIMTSTPQIIYPEHEKINYCNREISELKPATSTIKVPIVLIIDGRAVSSAESIIGIIKQYKLATIIGQPTAGTNGIANYFTLPGDYLVSFTGMKAIKLDGSQLFGIGILPDVYVNKTIKGVKVGRDEFLEKAIDIINRTNKKIN